jgi:hypothetical protein
MAKDFHDVPQDRAPTDLGHRLGSEFGLLTHPGAEAAREEHGFHGESSNLEAVVPDTFC